jgi:hypothetical protein
MLKLIVAACITVTAFCASTAQAAQRLDILVPAYFYPSASGSDWDRLTSAARSGASITAIVNPGSGPGTSSNSDYVRAINGFRAAGGTVIGYVPSGYIGQQVNAGASCQPASGGTYTTGDVIACAGLYKTFYAVDGIFVDEFGPPVGGALPGDVLSFYQSVYDGIKAVDPNWTVFGNPGQGAPESLLRVGSVGGADTLVTFENRAALYVGSPPAAYTSNFPASRFANILIESGAGFDVTAALTAARARNVGYIYITDDTLPNPYDRLPTYFDAEVAGIARLNAAVPEPATWGMMLAGTFITGTALRRRRLAGRRVGVCRNAVTSPETA